MKEMREKRGFKGGTWKRLYDKKGHESTMIGREWEKDGEENEREMVRIMRMTR